MTIIFLSNECNLVHNWIQFFISLYHDTANNDNDNNSNFEIENMNIVLN